MALSGPAGGPGPHAGAAGADPVTVTVTGMYWPSGIIMMYWPVRDRLSFPAARSP